jgi:hypothetical protein
MHKLTSDEVLTNIANENNEGLLDLSTSDNV